MVQVWKPIIVKTQGNKKQQTTEVFLEFQMMSTTFQK